MTPKQFAEETSLYGALIEGWTPVEADLVVHAELAGYNQPGYDEAADPEIRPVVLVFKEAAPLDEETAGFAIPANGDARVVAQEISGGDGGPGELELTCEVERYAEGDDPGETGWTTLRFRFAAVEIIDAPAAAPA